MTLPLSDYKALGDCCKLLQRGLGRSPGRVEMMETVRETTA